MNNNLHIMMKKIAVIAPWIFALCVTAIVNAFIGPTFSDFIEKRVLTSPYTFFLITLFITVMIFIYYKLEKGVKEFKDKKPIVIENSAYWKKLNQHIANPALHAFPDINEMVNSTCVKFDILSNKDKLGKFIVQVCFITEDKDGKLLIFDREKKYHITNSELEKPTCAKSITIEPTSYKQTFDINMIFAERLNKLSLSHPSYFGNYTIEEYKKIINSIHKDKTGDVIHYVFYVYRLRLPQFPSSEKKASKVTKELVRAVTLANNSKDAILGFKGSIDLLAITKNGELQAVDRQIIESILAEKK